MWKIATVHAMCSLCLVNVCPCVLSMSVCVECTIASASRVCFVVCGLLNKFRVHAFVVVCPLCCVKAAPVHNLEFEICLELSFVASFICLINTCVFAQLWNTSCKDVRWHRSV